MKKQLLGTEFNEVSGRTLSGSGQALQLVIIAWAEYLVAHASSFSASALLTAKDICDLINNSGE